MYSVKSVLDNISITTCEDILQYSFKQFLNFISHIVYSIQVTKKTTNTKIYTCIIGRPIQGILLLVQSQHPAMHKTLYGSAFDVIKVLFNANSRSPKKKHNAHGLLDITINS